MTDNFKLWRTFIELCGGLPENNRHGNLDKYYVIELMRRGKDNPDLPAANYHFRNYYIYSWKDLSKYEQEIKDICDLLHLRAYCSVNYKLMSQVALDTTAECARRAAAHDYKRFNSIFESCSGKFVDSKNKLWVVDIDDISLPMESVCTYLNTMKSGHNKVVLFKMYTKDGYHIITHPFNLKQFNDGWKNRFADAELPTIKKNHLTLLYENL